MQRPCSGIRCPMNASTCKCTGIEGCEYYSPAVTNEEVVAVFRAVADVLDANCKRMLMEAQAPHCQGILTDAPLPEYLNPEYQLPNCNAIKEDPVKKE